MGILGGVESYERVKNGWGWGGIFAREPSAKPRRFAAERSGCPFSAIFDKVGSSEVIKILQFIAV